MTLEEKGDRYKTLKLEDLIVILSQHDDFKNENNSLETMLTRKERTALFLPSSTMYINTSFTA